MSRYLFLLLLIVSTPLLSQNSNLISSIKHSGIAQVFELTDEEAYQLYKAPRELPILPTDRLIATIDIDSSISDQLAPGHYIKVYSDKNQFHSEVFSIPDFHVEIGNNQADLFVKLWDSNHEITTAKLFLNGKKLKYNTRLHGYWKRRTNKDGLLEVHYNNRRWFFKISKELKNSRFKRFTRKVVNGKVIRHIISPPIFILELPFHGYKSIRKGYSYGNVGQIKNFAVRTYEKVACKFDDYHCLDNYEDRFEGYFITNKPKYRPGDTLKLKALILNRKGKVKENKPQNVYLWKDYSEYVLLGQTTPYRKGAFTYELILHDSLDLRLDQNYKISIGPKPYKAKASKYFNYEDYELKSIDLTLRTEGDIIFKDSTFTIYAEGKDENDITVPDARLTMYATTGRVTKTLEKHVFVPDTLWTYHGELKPNGETPIVFPDSLLPNANLEIKISAELRNSENEYVRKNLSLNYLTNTTLNTSLDGDSIQFDYRINGNSIPIVGKFKSNNGSWSEVTFPYKVKTDHLASGYQFIIHEKDYSVSMKNHRPRLPVYTSRNSDSLNFNLVNDSQIPFTYFIYKYNKLLKKGYTKNLNHTISKPGKAKYYLHVQYLWCNEIFTDDYEVDQTIKQIILSSNLPSTGYPGMQTVLEIVAKDEKGRPVANADISAYSITNKFNEPTPELKSFTKWNKKFRHLINRFNLKTTYQNRQDDLDYKKWKSILGLDSIAYYDFIYPRSDHYQQSIDMPDSSTLLVPFVVKDGKVLTSHVVYIDHKPQYFSWNTIPDKYAFEVDSGYHRVKIRTEFLSVTMDSVLCQPGKRTILSLTDKESANVFHEDIKNSLTKAEKRKLNRYILPYRPVSYSDGAFSYLQQGNRFYQIAPNSRSYSLTGPIDARNVYLKVFERFEMNFRHESGFEYDFSPVILKMRSFEHYPSYLNKKPLQDFKSKPLTKEEFERARQNYIYKQRLASRIYTNPVRNTGRNSSLHLIKKAGRKIDPSIVNTLLYKLDDFEFIRVYPGETDQYYDLEPGLYRSIKLKRDKSYITIDSIKVQKGGRSFYNHGHEVISPSDTFSIDIDSVLTEIGEHQYMYRSQKEKLKQQHVKRYKHEGDGDNYRGYVISTEDGSPLPGVNVIIKGTTIGTVTDIEGYYDFNGPFGATLVFSFIGLNTQEVQTLGNETLEVSMHADVKQLSEVVVMGYGVETRKQSLSYSISTIERTLRGKAAGVSISAAAGAMDKIHIRGASSVSADSTPLIIVDGVIWSDDKVIDPQLVDNTSILKGVAATSLYGSRGANGVILITTKSYKSTLLNKTTPLKAIALSNEDGTSNIRSNFKDDAFWAPQLKTDKSGRATINVAFPDDITNWKTVILAYGKGRRTGRLTLNTKSTLPITGRLSMPRFLMPGDSVYVQGKTVNRTGIPQLIKHNFLIDDEVQNAGSYEVNNFQLDSLLVTPKMANDTISITYAIENENGFKDGEQREIPIFENGIEVSKGYFSSLDSDTTLVFNFPDSLGDVSLYATSNMGDILEDEAKKLINYPYGCNEQLASRLIAICHYNELNKDKKGYPFYARQARQIIRTLKKRQLKNGYWGWWSERSTAYWVTAHVIKAMKLADQVDFGVDFYYDEVIENAVWDITKHNHASNKLAIMNTLHLLDSSVNITPHLNSLKLNWDHLSLLNRFKVWSLEQRIGKYVSRDSIMNYAAFDAYGNLYFEENKKNKSHSFRNSSPLLSIEGYKLLKHIGEDRLATKVVNYLLSKRSSIGWRNTYESAVIIDALKEEIKDFSKNENGLKLSGIINDTVMEFPFESSQLPSGELVITKTGRQPVYLTGYQTQRLETPKAKTKNFILKTSYDKAEVNNLKAGEVVKMFVEIELLKDAEFLAVDIPIPASCTYVDKKFGKEDHREYYRHKVSLFYKKLNKGKHKVEIELIARYKGSFNQNPAQAHWMYFPTISGWNESKRITVE